MVWISKQKFFNRYLPMFLSVVLVVGGVFVYQIAENSQPAEASISFGNSTRGASFSTTNTQSWTSPSVNVGDIAIVATGVNNGANVTSVTWGGQTMTLAPNATLIVAGSHRVQIFYLVNPPKGASTVTMNAGSNWTAGFGGSMTFSGVSQTNPIDVVAGASSTSGSTTFSSILTPTRPKDFVVDSVIQIGNFSLSATVPSVKTQAGNNGTYSWSTSYQGPITSSTATMAWSSTGVGTDWVDVLVSLNSANKGVIIQNSKVCVGGCNQIQLVQSNSNASTSGTTLLATYSKSNTANNLLIVAAQTGDGSSISIADTAGDNFIQLQSSTWDFSIFNTALYYAIAKGGSNNTVTFTAGSGTGGKQLQIFEYSGTDPSSPLDQSNITTTLGCSGNCMTSALINKAQPTELLFAISSGGTTSMTPFIPFTKRFETFDNNGSTPSRLISADDKVFAAGSNGVTMNFATGESFGVLIFATFKAASQSGGAKLKIQPR